MRERLTADLFLDQAGVKCSTPTTKYCAYPIPDIEGLGTGRVVGHAGEMMLFERHSKLVCAFMGRRHWYEGVGWEPVVMPVELMRRMGINRILITNAAGGINPSLAPGKLMIIRDHINTCGINPLIGEIVEGWGPRFPDQSNVYTPELVDPSAQGCH